MEKPAPKREEKPKPQKKPKQVVIRNTGTAMGAALAAALAGTNLAVVEDESRGDNTKGAKNSAKSNSDNGLNHREKAVELKMPN